MRTLFIMTLFVSLYSNAKSVDLRDLQTPVKNQKDRNTCAYFAVTALLESAILKEFGVEVDISEQYQVFAGKEIHGENQDVEFGETHRVLDNFKKQSYFFSEAQIPYKTSYFEQGMPCYGQDPFNSASDLYCFSQAPVNTTNLKKTRFFGLKKSWVSGMWSGKDKADQIKEQLDQQRPVVVTLKVYPSTWYEDGSTVFNDEINSKCEAGEYSCYGHAVLITGYDDETQEFTFKNSWSSDWGKQGYGKASFDYVRKYSFDPLSAYFDRFLADFDF